MATQKSHISYDDVVATLPTLETEEQINLLEVLSSVLKKSISKTKKEHSLLELEGLGAEIWMDVDIENYLRCERDSWD